MPTEAERTARRALEICNACRFCDGYCAVFEATALRRAFSAGDLAYMANLCHNCRACYYACQYAPPHEFALNLPRSLAELRAETYARFAWPRPLGALFRRNGVVVAAVLAATIALALMLTMGLSPGARVAPPGAFYAVVPWGVMVSVAGAALAFALVSVTASLALFWRQAGARASHVATRRALRRTMGDVLTLRNLGGGHGCNDRDESFSRARRLLHHAVFHGFLLCVASTLAAAVYGHVLGWPAPYPLWSVPVVLGAAGGVGMIAGAAGLLWIRMTGDPAPAARKSLGADCAFLILLLLTAGSGLALLIWREAAGMAVLLAVHLGVVVSFFLLIPYSKLVHGFYRALALLRAAMERPSAG